MVMMLEMCSKVIGSNLPKSDRLIKSDFRVKGDILDE